MGKSIITEFEDISAFSGRPREAYHHVIFGSGLRKLANEDRLILPLTHSEHNMGTSTECIHGNPAAEKLSKMVGQLAWEKEYYRSRTVPDGSDPAREAFRKRYSQSWL